MKILAAFKQHLNQAIPDLERSKLIVATSGGSDSLALCFLLKEMISQVNFSFLSIIVDHKLRIESSKEAQEVSKLLNDKGIASKIIEWEGEKPKSNIQEEARLARYEILTNYCKANNFNYLLTAHQKNDQAENFIIRLEHGSGLYGLSGIQQKTKINQVKVIRPLLNLDKNQLKDFLNSKNIEWVEDPSNENEKYARVKARNFLKSSPHLIKKLINASNNLNNAREAIEFYVDKFFKENVTINDQNAVFDFDIFNQQPQEIRFRVLDLILHRVIGIEQKIRGERINNLLHKIILGKDFTASTLGKCLIKRKKNQIIITPENNIN